MKKIILSVVMFVGTGIVFAGEIVRLSKIDMNTTTHISAPNVATISAVSGQRNCINNLDIKTLGDYQLQILTGTSTDYAILLSSGQSLVRTFSDDDAICTDANEILTIKMTTVTAGTFELNYSGFRY